MHRALPLMIAMALLACSGSKRDSHQNGASGGNGGVAGGSGGQSQGNGGSNAATGGSAGGMQSTGGNQASGGVSASGGTAGGGNGGAAAGGNSGAAAGGLSGSGGAAGAAAEGGQAGAAASGGTGGAEPTGAREIQNFNQSWKFKRSDVTGADATDFDDASWNDIGLPHSFNLPYFINAKFYVGYGWYRKHFTVPANWAEKSVFLEFQAAFDQAQIYVNGKQVGEHIGGYNGFSIDDQRRHPDR